jgi:hypothetical protein
MGGFWIRSESAVAPQGYPKILEFPQSNLLPLGQGRKKVGWIKRFSAPSPASPPAKGGEFFRRLINDYM